MKLRKTGPEKDAAAEFITTIIAESDDLDYLKRCGEQEARNLGAETGDWIMGPSTVNAQVRRWQLDTGKDCILTISDD